MVCLGIFRSGPSYASSRTKEIELSATAALPRPVGLRSHGIWGMESPAETVVAQNSWYDTSEASPLISGRACVRVPHKCWQPEGRPATARASAFWSCGGTVRHIPSTILPPLTIMSKTTPALNRSPGTPGPSGASYPALLLPLPVLALPASRPPTVAIQRPPRRHWSPSTKTECRLMLLCAIPSAWRKPTPFSTAWMNRAAV
mmetsp:Transcript_30119/g.68237  ORF Transcript_30119/g.68237 Transcript_30119/m.68237 type:complete len:202 (+) Transcript_30119:1248-1853(+)